MQKPPAEPTAPPPSAPPPPQRASHAKRASAPVAPPADASRENSGGVRWLGHFAPWMTSSILHAACLVVLALVFIVRPGGGGDSSVAIDFRDAAGPTEMESLADDASFPKTATSPTIEVDTSLLEMPVIEPPDLINPDAAAVTANLNEHQSFTPRLTGGLVGRSAANRNSLALENGGTAESEAAVEMGLKWLAAHQFEDGGWRFDFRDAPGCNGACADHGVFTSTTGATGLALLAFLGAGYTHKDGPYQSEVEKGLYYLTNQMQLSDDGGDLGEGVGYAMYPHAIATLALCEAYAMTGDETLKFPAQFAVDFIVHAQHEAGGWRYHPRDPGDTTVTGWQVIALKGALLAGLEVPSPVWFGVKNFLDSVQQRDGAFYGYRSPDKNAMNTSIGLLCRMMMGWERDHPALQQGVRYLAKLGPSPNNTYFNYYASQVMRHNGGDNWERWNQKLRDYLVEQQVKQGHERGSWQFREKHSLGAGRLYNTAMAIMTLEVYYRFLPLYDDAAVNMVP